MDTEKYTFKPVTRDNWPDMERFFESRGCPGHCWCMAWRKMEADRMTARRSDRKEAFRNGDFRACLSGKP